MLLYQARDLKISIFNLFFWKKKKKKNFKFLDVYKTVFSRHKDIFEPDTIIFFTQFLVNLQSVSASFMKLSSFVGIFQTY